MDNVTHALAGILLADVTAQVLTPRGVAVDRTFRRRARWASAISNNLPDLDFLVRGLTPGRVGYLLHHRGHSHTLLVASLLGALAFVALRRLWRKPSGVPPQLEFRVLLALCVFGPWVHVAMDFSNNYGVHPFWPLYDGWLYGDAVFIIEPWFWILTIPAIAFASEHRASKLLLAAIVLVGVGLAWVTNYAGVATATCLTLAAVAVPLANRRLSQRTRTFAAFTASLAVAMTFFVGSSVARAKVKEAARTGTLPGFAAVELVDTSLAPAPSNPFCWSAMSVGRRADRYELFVSTVTIAASIVSLADCAVEPTGHTLSLAIPSLESTSNVRWDGEWSAPLAELRRVYRDDCNARAYLRWARLPFWLEKPRELLLGDLRYDRSPQLDFAEIVGTSPPAVCPKRVPPWTPPRTDVMQPEAQP